MEGRASHAVYLVVWPPRPQRSPPGSAGTTGCSLWCFHGSRPQDHFFKQTGNCILLVLLFCIFLLLLFALLRIRTQNLFILGNCSTAELHPHLLFPFSFSFGDRVILCIPDWLQACNAPALGFRVLELEAWTRWPAILLFYLTSIFPFFLSTHDDLDRTQAGDHPWPCWWVAHPLYSLHMAYSHIY